MYEANPFRIRDLTLQKFLIGVARTIVPIAIAALYLLWVYTLGDVGALLFPLIAAYFFPPFGKESVIPLGVSLGIHPALMAVTIALVDLLVGLFLLWNYRILYYIPILGNWARKTELKAKKMVAEGRGFSKLAFLGLVLWVMVPFQGSGAVSATIIGKMSGMDAKKVLLAIAAGALAGTFMIAYSFNYILLAFQADLLLGVVVVAVAAVAVTLALLRYRRAKNGDRAAFRQIKDFSLLANLEGGASEEPEAGGAGAETFLDRGR